MMRTRSTKIVCGVCGVEKKQSNHWFIVAASNETPIPSVLIESHDNIWMNEAFFPDDLSIDVCGLPCAFKHISEVLDASK